MLRVNVWGNIAAAEPWRHGHELPNLPGNEQAQTGDLLPSPTSDKR